MTVLFRILGDLVFAVSGEMKFEPISVEIQIQLPGCHLTGVNRDCQQKVRTTLL
jgi:hypothetical protein